MRKAFIALSMALGFLACSSSTLSTGGGDGGSSSGSGSSSGISSGSSGGSSNGGSSSGNSGSGGGSNSGGGNGGCDTGGEYFPGNWSCSYAAADGGTQLQTLAITQAWGTTATVIGSFDGGPGFSCTGGRCVDRGL